MSALIDYPVTLEPSRKALARQRFRSIVTECGMNHRETAAVLGVTEKTVSAYGNAGVIPATTAEWLAAVEYIHVTPGRVVIELHLPEVRARGAYVRAHAESASDVPQSAEAGKNF